MLREGVGSAVGVEAEHAASAALAHAAERMTEELCGLETTVDELWWEGGGGGACSLQ